ncbi:MAG: efflux RND transporter permease subunit [Elusimicrobia bacterium]|nr:efflux RND transporter permease subunit [Elusimicrobiota bacterium]MDE2236323.1 efflux RND transporter permease subunit [Elusimicrobiota bacterium]MDE2424417.1 efflux RND transporter permease subunit [Elusimicrobiota bacterium]
MLKRFEKLLGGVLEAPSLVALGVILVVVLAVVLAPGLKVDLFPPLDFPVLDVSVEVPSFSSLEMERQVTLPIESAASGVLGVRRVYSTSGTGIALVGVQFQWGTDMLMARQLLTQALASIQGDLPAGTQPDIENLSATLAMIEGYAIQGGRDPVALRDLAIYDLKPRLQRVPGVYKVLIKGGKILEYAVYPNPSLMIKFGVALDELRAALEANNILSSPGIVNDHQQELVLHSNGQYAGPKEVGETVIAVKNGVPVRVKDVARVADAYQWQRGDTSEDGKPALLVNILKQPSFDTGAVAKGVASVMARFEKGLPEGYSVRNYYDQAGLVRDSIASVKEAVEIGAFFVVVVLLLFLRHFRSTVIAALSIPLSVLTALVAMRLFGVGVNIMSLGGLAIGTAIIVDNTIIVLENVFRWLATPALCRGRGKLEVVAAACAEVATPVFSSTLANIAIFLPMVMVAGLPGRLFAPVSATVSFALLASLVVALTAIPIMADKWLGGHDLPEEKEGLLHRLYDAALKPAFQHPKLTVFLGLLPVAFAVLAFARLDTSFLPALDEGALLIQTDMPMGTSLAEAEKLNAKIERWAEKLPGVVNVVRSTGHAPGAEDTDNVNHSDIMLKLMPKNQRPLGVEDLVAKLSAQTDAMPNVLVNYLMPLADKINDALGGVPADIGVDLYGQRLGVLHQYAARLMPKLQRIQGLVDLRPPTDMPVPSLQVTIDKEEAGRLGISGQAIHEALQAFSSGLAVTGVRQLQKIIEVVIHYTPAGQNLDLEALKSLPLKTAGASTVPLEQVAAVGYGAVPSQIQHDHMTRKIVLSANVRGRNANSVAADVAAAADSLRLPTGYSWSFSGRYASQQSAMSNMAQVLFLAVTIVGVILWLEFGSFGQVGLVLLTIPLASVGAVIALWLTRQTINVSSMIGAVLLVGIVVRNGIMLLDYMNLKLDEGAPVREAVHAASMKRLRPILMTAAVMILGMLPLAVGWGTGSELQRPLAIAVVGGILTSTLLTIIVLPAAALLIVKKPQASQL